MTSAWKQASRFNLHWSPFLISLLLLLGLDYVLAITKPLSYVYMAGCITHDANSIDPKIIELRRPWIIPDILFVGNSCPMSALFAADVAVGAAPKDYSEGFDWTYTKAHCLTSALDETLGRKPHIFNLSVRGTMCSDVDLIVNKTLEYGKKPKVIIYGTAPMAFVSNQMAPAGKGLYYRYFDKYKNPLHGNNFQTAMENLVCSWWHLYDIRGDYQYFCQLLYWQAVDALSLRLNLPQATPVNPASHTLRLLLPEAGDKKTTTWQQRQDATVKMYQEMFQPPNFQRLNEEITYLEHLTKACKSAQIDLIVINMPVMPSFIEIINPKLYSAYLLSLKRTCNDNNACFIDMAQDKTFLPKDFHDCSHLGTTGGAKFCQRLAETLKANQGFRSAIGAL